MSKNKVGLTLFLVLSITVLAGLLVQAKLVGTEQLGTVNSNNGTEYFVVAQNYSDDGSYYSEIWLQKRRWQSTYEDKKVMKIQGKLSPEQKEKAFAAAVRTLKEKGEWFSWEELEEVVDIGKPVIKIVKGLKSVATAASHGLPVPVMINPELILDTVEDFTGMRTPEDESL